MGKRIITTENLEEDIKIEGQLRPQHLTEYIGQEKAKRLWESILKLPKPGERLWIMCFFMVLPDLEKRRLQESLQMRWEHILR